MSIWSLSINVLRILLVSCAIYLVSVRFTFILLGHNHGSQKLLVVFLSIYNRGIWIVYQFVMNTCDVLYKPLPNQNEAHRTMILKPVSWQFCHLYHLILLKPYYRECTYSTRIIQHLCLCIGVQITYSCFRKCDS